MSTMTGGSGENDIPNDRIARFVHALGFRSVGREQKKAQGNDPVSKQSFLHEARHSNKGTPATAAQHFPTFIVFEKRGRRLR